MTDSSSELGLTYKAAGVDIHAGNELIEHIKPISKRTLRPEVLTGLGGFSGLCEIPAGYRHPVLVSGTDGVGTKLKLAIETQQHSTIGIDLVAMCVNDVIVCGAEPLFFLDYFATGKLQVEQAKSVITGIGAGCELAGCTLIGGETAEMPGMYHGDDYDLAGFCVGVVEKENILNGAAVKPGDQLIALASSGPHSNGYSLIRKIIEHHAISLNHEIEGVPLKQLLLTPTRIYVKSILQLLKQMPIHAMAHITGGGLVENLPRVLPDHTKAVIDLNSWRWPAIFEWLQHTGKVPTEDMWRTFNCGVGMVLTLPEESTDAALTQLAQLGETAWRIGRIKEHSEKSPVVVLN